MTRHCGSVERAESIWACFTLLNRATDIDACYKSMKRKRDKKSWALWGGQTLDFWPI